MFEEAKQNNNQNNQTEEPAMPVAPVAPPENINERIERLNAEGKTRGGKKMAIIGAIAFLIIAGGASAGFMYWDKVSGFLGLDSNSCDYSNQRREYTGKSEAECAVVKFTCEEGEIIFNDECGCGCETVQEELIFCAQDAKQCADGSYVSRVAPDCEFAECPEVQKIDTSDWQTYRNEEYGFEVSYPEYFAEQELESDNILLSLRKDDNGKTLVLRINYKENYNIIERFSDIDKSKIGINGNLAYKYFFQEGAGYSGVALIQVDEDAIELIYDFVGSMQDSEMAKEDFVQNNFNQIISTFKFIDQTEDISNWQTYRNEEYGFEFKYPDNYHLSDVNPNNKNIFFDTEGPGSGLQIDILDISMVDRKNELIVEQWNNYEAQEVDDDQWNLFYRDGTEMVPGASYKSIRQYNNVIIEVSLYRRGEELLNQILSAFKFLTDTDSDGLYDDDEGKYGTDINNPDSDGDGYLDGAEVENGYNPMGEGVL